MLFGVIVLILVGAIAYFHYVQGFFSATISMILAIIAAVVAFSYHEVLVRSLLRGKFADEASALMLVALFAGVYTLLRVLFDKAVPGNIRLPVLMDKIGAAAAGLVAGIFAVGIFAIAVQTLPFGPSIAGYARYQVSDRQAVQIPGARGSQMTDAYANDVLKSDQLDDPQMASRLMIPADDIVVNTTSHLSAGGSLAGPQSLDAVHPSFLDEAFGQRLGVQTGAKHVAYNLPDGEKQVDLRGVYTIDQAATAPGESNNIRKVDEKTLKPLASTQQDIILVTRLVLSRNASDSDNNTRVSTGSVRLVAKGKNYFPIGTLDQSVGALIVRVNKPDDFMIVPSDGTVDFVFQVPRDDIGLSGDPKKNTGPMQIAPEVFVEVKRLGYVDLSGQEVKREAPPPLEEKTAQLLRKKDLPMPKGAAAAAANVGARESSFFQYKDTKVTPTLFTQIEVGGYEGTNAEVTFGSGKATLRDKKFQRLTVEPNETIARLKMGDHLVGELWTPEGNRIVQVIGAPPAKTSNAWEWAEKLDKFDITDTNGGAYKVRGALVKVKSGNPPADHLIAKYDPENQLSSLPTNEGRPTEVTLIFVVPENTTLKEFRIDGKLIKTINQEVK